MKLTLALLFAVSLHAARVPSTRRFCIPQNTTSSSTAFYPLDIPTVFGGQIPQPGERWCDPNFGTDMLRLSDNMHGVTAIAELQEILFSNYVNADGSINSQAWAVVIDETSEVLIYNFNPVAFTTAGLYTVFAPLDPGGTPINIIGQQGIWWSNDPTDAKHQSTILFIGGMKLWKVDISDLSNRAVLVADFTGFFTLPIPPGNGPAYQMQYCSASADTRSIGCAIESIGPYFPAVGWVVWKSGTGSTPSGACPADLSTVTTTCVVALFVNGTHSASYDTFQTLPPILSVAEGNTYTYVIQSDINLIGYKFTLDKSGTWINAHTSYTKSTVTPTKGPNPDAGVLIPLNDTAISASRMNPTWAAVAYKFVQGYGHAASAAASGYSADAGFFCAGGCVREHLFASHTTDPGFTTNGGTAVSDVWPFGASGMLLTYFGQTAPAEIGIGLYGACNRTAIDTQVLYCGEIYMLKPDTKAVRRIGYMRAPFVTYLDEPHEVMSQDGRYIAFSTTLNTALNASTIRTVVIVRVP